MTTILLHCTGHEYDLITVGEFYGFQVGSEVGAKDLYPNLIKKIKGFDTEKKWVVISLIDPVSGNEIGDDILVDESDLSLSDEGVVKPFIGENEIAWLQKIGKLSVK
ncbi:MAG: hypothetical protein COU81_01220 [Candidatus Portnoybacteria bacterium CG10_big_fil_rev_8_21_14_0_10_36_7]|uniref:Uncharacterized protein n=1 Tax=Candidatus Portnoybacteria bacterium CG10_big_fil_rev_8_21_14_0_10_36_7 TaxID=1974812 RepID=A0A2M8KEK1_9BACT|nr:MAG: hypothetical protein COU81_01220 [Candidatus Portnoybacteria bacterium CG10_big_fil_rev_8_21_14_0_10_36_7]